MEQQYACIGLHSVMPKIRSQYDNCRAYTEQLPKKYRYESKTDYLFKYDNCAWIYSECSCSVVFSKYEYCHYSAWNILGNCAWNILEQYDNWQVVLQGAVEIYAPLGEFHTAWSFVNLESTIIVLGNIQPKNCSFNLGSTII